MSDLDSAKHNLHYSIPATTWDEGLPLGNGLLGALVWGDGAPLIISLDRTDLWDSRPVPEYHAPEYSYATMRRLHRENRRDDLIQLFEVPYYRAAPTKLPVGRIELNLSDDFHAARLDLDTALASVEFRDDAKAQVFVHATQPIGMLRLRGASGAAFHLRAPAFGREVDNAASGKDELAPLGYPPPREFSGAGFRAFLQDGWNGSQFAIHLAWRESAGELVAAWSIASSLEGDRVRDIAQQRVEAALDAGFETLFDSHRAWWREYWNTTGLALPDTALERQWFLDTSKFGAAARRGAPPIALQGPWTADDGGLPPWKGDYHHDLNTQLSYWPCYSGNRLEQGLGFLDWLWDTRENCREWTHRFFDMPGLNVPMTADPNNSQLGGWYQYTHAATTGAWLSHHFYLHWKYSADREFLATRAYPYLRECAVFIEAVTAERDEGGFRTLPLSSSPEINDNRPEAWFDSITNYDLSLARWLLGATAEMADELKRPEDASHWGGVLAEMPDLATGEDGRLLVARGQALLESHRHFSHLMAIHPLGLISPDDENGRRIIAASFAELDKLGTSLWVGYSWAWLGNMAARAGDGERAAKELKIFLAFTLRNSFHANGDQSGEGYSTWVYRPFTLEGNFAFAAGIQEMLLQSHDGLLRIFPAIPGDWQDVSFHNLRGQGAFLVCAQMEHAQLKRVSIRAEQGGVCRVLLRGEQAIRERELQPGEVWEVTG